MKKLSEKQIQNRLNRIAELEKEDAELKQLDLRVKTMSKKREITAKVFKISRKIRKIEHELGWDKSPEYIAAVKAVKDYCDSYNAKLDAKNETKAKRKSKSKKRKRKETQTHFLRDEEAGIVCAIIHE